MTLFLAKFCLQILWHEPALSWASSCSTRCCNILDRCNNIYFTAKERTFYNSPIKFFVRERNTKLQSSKKPSQGRKCKEHTYTWNVCLGEKKDNFYMAPTRKKLTQKQQILTLNLNKMPQILFTFCPRASADFCCYDNDRSEIAPIYICTSRHHLSFAFSKMFAVIFYKARRRSVLSLFISRSVEKSIKWLLS